MASPDYLAPDGVRTRGSVIVVPGRGETRGVYARFGARLAYDAYRVRVVELPDASPADTAAFSRELADRLADAVAGVADGQPGGLVRPLVLVGSDLGAAGIAALLADGDQDAAWWPQAVVLAGLPGYRARGDGGWEEELDLRTHCPVHRGVLASDAAVRRGTLAGFAPDALLDAVYRGTADVPQLLLIGDADPLADRSGIARAAKSQSAARLAVVRGGHHDVLNDLQHRSVAAEVVTFLEMVRDGLSPAIAVEASTW
jgi:alpha-beta hydrolase superfamily lysophospholipase